MRLDRRSALLVAGRDLRDAAGDLRLAIAMVGLAVAIPIGAGLGIRALAFFGGGVSSVVERMSIVGAFFVVFLPASYTLVLALESFVGERERSTLEVLLSTPLREAEIYFGKVAAVLSVSLILCFGALIAYCAVTFAGLGYFPLGILLSLAVATICQVAAMVAGAVIVSANARTMRAANVMASFIILPMSVVLQVEAGLILIGRGEFLWAFAAAMAVGAFILLRMGLRGFSREALLARQVGGGNLLRRSLSAALLAYRQAPAGLAMIRARRLPILLSALAFPAGLGVGWLAGGTLLRHSWEYGLVQATAPPAGDPWLLGLSILLADLVAILLAWLFAAATLGLTGFVLTAAPGALIGYTAASSGWVHALAGFPDLLVRLPVAAIAGGLAIQIGASVIHMEPDGGWLARVMVGQATLVRALLWMVPLLAAGAALQVLVHR